MKRMKSAEALEALAKNPNYNMTADEERLYDLLTFHKTGKRTEKFKDTGKKKPKSELLILKHDPNTALPVLDRTDPPISPGVIVNDNAISDVSSPSVAS